MAVALFRLQEGWPLVFRCGQLRATLSPSSCATNFTRNLSLTCSGCQIGAEHAAAPNAPRPAELDSKTIHGYTLPCRQPEIQACVRCEARGSRRVGPGLCVSCLNRQAELLRGINSKGTFPSQTAAQLHKCLALLAGEVPRPKNVFRAQSQCSPHVHRLSGGALVTGIFTGREEFCRWLAEFFPDARLLDFEEHI